jgi:hypothetical protein
MAARNRQGRKALPLIIASMLLTLFAAPSDTRAQSGGWQFGSTPSFSSGKYGTEVRTEVLHTPITARRLFNDGDVTFVLPVTCIWGDNGVTVINGSPVPQQRVVDSSTSNGRAVTGGRTTAATATGATNARVVRNCGMGDVVVRGRYYLLDERAWMPTVAVRGHVKIPTASSERGLGTGRPDEGVGVEITRTIAGGMAAMADVGYTVIGAPSNLDYNNNWWYDVGIGQDIRKMVNLSIFFEEYRAIVPGLANARDVLTAVSVAGGGGWRVQTSMEFGLSDGAAEHGITVGASRRF